MTTNIFNFMGKLRKSFILQKAKVDKKPLLFTNYIIH